jgi:hypothetical protein
MGSPSARFRTDTETRRTLSKLARITYGCMQHMAVLIGDKPARVLSDDGERGLVPWSLRSNRPVQSTTALVMRTLWSDLI